MYKELKNDGKIKIALDDGAILPTRGHADDAGLDLYSRDNLNIEPHGSAIFDTGVHIEIPRGYAGFLKSKSGLNVKRGLTSVGVIDSGYTGSITVKLYNHSDNWYDVHRGDKISQLVLLPIITPELELVASADEFEQSERGNNGFGSTGR